MVEYKDLLPIFKQLYPSTRRKLLALPVTREGLRSDLQIFIRKVGPSLGDVYTEKTLDWAQFQEVARTHPISPQNKVRSKDE